MFKQFLQSLLRTVTDHSAVVVLVMLLLTAGVAVGISDLQLASEASNQDAFDDTTVAQKHDYISAHYGNQSESDDAPATEPVAVYVRDTDGNVLSKSALLQSLRYQRTVLENESVAGALQDDGDRPAVFGVSNVIARRAAGDPDADLDAQISALEDVSEAEVQAIVEETLVEGSPALVLLPNDYEPGTATAESRRIVFRFTAPDGEAERTGGSVAAEQQRSRAQHALYSTAASQVDRSYFTLGEHAIADARSVYNQNMMELIVPAALLVIVAVLAFAYRDLVDILVGFTGVLVSLVWMFGILGWLKVSAGMTVVVGPVLIVGLSVDYGLHVFMRYREQRGDEGIREPMYRSLSSVSVALVLVTLTTSVGFLANATNEFASIRNLSIGITLGVISALVVFVTLVPALKVTIDSLLERVGVDRRKQPLGKHGRLRPLLTAGVTLARRAAPAVIVIALLIGAASAVTWTELDRQSFQQDTDGVAEWKQDLPGPLAWEVTDLEQDADYVREHYQSADESDRRIAQVLVQGDVTAPQTLEQLHDARQDVAQTDAAFKRRGTAPVKSPLSVARSVAEDDETVAAALEARDTNGNGVPDKDLAGLYDVLYDAAPQQAATVIERTDGEYRSVRMLVPLSQRATVQERADVMQEAADNVEGSGTTRTATAVSEATLMEAGMSQTAAGILRTLLLALGAVFVMLLIVYRLAEGSASLGAVTVVPIVLVATLLVGCMFVLDVPLTLVTALLMSLVVGLGIDYNIHVSDRFAQELAAGRTIVDALTEAVTGTGGALLGSTLTSTGAFSALLLHPHPQFQSFGTLVVLALTLSFVVSVFVLPSLLLVWARYTDAAANTRERQAAAPSTLDD